MVAALPVREHLSLAEGDSVAIELCAPFAAKAVMFDIDGTIVDSVGAYLEVARIAAAPHGIEVSGEHVRRSLATGSGFWKDVVPLDAPDREALIKSMSAHAQREWPRVLREHGRTFAGLAQTLDALKRLGIALGIVSGARPEVLELLREDGILERFDTVILGTDVAKRKPDPEGILECLRRLAIAPEEAIYVGDTAVDIQASRAAGVRAVGVLTGAADSATLSAHWPDRLLPSHAGLTAIVEPA
ncbi:MAG: HAD family hydrolase [Betaproteobacteria bacterium]|nr:HAD family hydrolase [Betaproteobacteria bacterium]